MKLIAQVKLLPTEEQAKALKRTMERANAACDYLSQRAWDNRTFGQYALHKLAYYETRRQFPDLSAQIVVRCIARVADAYKLDRKTQRAFRSLSAIAYDDRILRWYVSKAAISIWTVAGRQHIPFVCGEKQRALLQTRQGESDLTLVQSKWYLLATCNVEETPEQETDGVLGVDLGITNIAVDSDGEIHSASQVNNVRYRHRRLRTKLQRKGSKSAKRRLRSLSGKEARFAKDVNHTISKSIVAKAQGTRHAIALEDLGGIRDRVTVRRCQRATLHSWSFYQLRSFVLYKARRAGVPVFLVDPRNTSRTCPRCGTIDKRNRVSQSSFLCVSCGFAGLADHIAAGNIARRAAVNPPNVSAPVPGTSSRL
jgi:IS605 OrfB family transposase